MSILIDWDMPKACRDCPLQIGGMCRMYSDEEKRLDDIDLTIERPDWCPLIEIPAGVRLIDANKMRRSVKFTGGTGDLFKEWIDRQPTVIETEADQ